MSEIHLNKYVQNIIFPQQLCPVTSIILQFYTEDRSLTIVKNLITTYQIAV